MAVYRYSKAYVAVYHILAAETVVSVIC